MSFPTAALLHCRAPGQINSLVWLHRVVAAVAAQLDLNGKLILGMPNSEHLKMMNKAVSAWHKRRVATCLCCMTRLLLRWAGSALQPAVTATVSGDSMLRPRRGRGGGRRATAPAPARCTSPPPSDSAPPSPGRTRRWGSAAWRTAPQPAAPRPAEAPQTSACGCAAPARCSA